MRTDWDTYFMQLAHAAAERSTCPRLHVGTVLVKYNKVIATGYNGAPSGAEHCDDIGCLMVEGSCKRTVHAEANAVKQAGFLKRAGSTIYITDTPCLNCAKLIASKGIAEVVFDRDYIAKKREHLADHASFAEEYAIGEKLDKWEKELLALFAENGIVYRRIGGE